MRWNLKLKSFFNNKENEQAAQELKILEDDIATARDFLKQNKSYFQGKKIPIHIILGPSRFGKSTILSQSGLGLIDVNGQPVGSVAPTKYCAFWFTEDAMYIDTAGNYTKPEFTKPRHDLVWRGFISLLQKYFGKDAISDALIILDLPTITQDQTLLKQTLFCIRERIYEMATLIKNLHTHIIFTKCDRILGFTDFFAMLDAKERLQPFGISFDTTMKFDIIPAFEAKFDELLEHLNNRVIENLQKSSTTEKRSLIKMFPSQLDNIRQTFLEVLDKIPTSKNLLLSGIYFTSSIQAGAPIDPIKATSLQPLDLKEKLSYGLESTNIHSFFVEDIFNKAIHLPKQQKPQRSNLPHLQIGYFYAFLIAALIIVASSTIAYHSYYKNIKAINQISSFLQTQDLNDHNNLYNAKKLLKQNSKSWWLTFGINKTKAIDHALTKIHQDLFIKTITTQLENYLGNRINTKDFSDTRKIYRALQTYLMIGTLKKLDKTYVRAWFNDYWTDVYTDKGQKNNLLQQLDSTLKFKFQAELNQQLISTIRNNLLNLPPEIIIYLLLENSYLNQNLKIDTAKPISKMYTSQNFHKIYDDSIPHMVNNPPTSDWALGDIKLQINEKSTNDIIKAVRGYYLEQYAKTWENSLKLEASIDWKNLKEGAKYLKKFSSNTTSPLIILLQQIKHNTKINNPPPSLSKDLNNKLHFLNTINIADLQRNLGKMAQYVDAIATKSNPNKAAFDAVTGYAHDAISTHPITMLKTFSNEQSPLLQTYLQSIATNVWQTLLNATYSHINQAWQQNIIPTYKEILLNKYPIFKESTDNVKLNDFNKFFGPNGLMDKFFNQYIQPLVKIDKTNWSWKIINGQKIIFPQNTLEVFLRAALIQKMFYAEKTHNPKIRFALTPVGMTQNTTNFTLSIDNQKISFSHNDEKKSRHLTWPGTQPGVVNLSFTTDQGKTFTSSEVGPWAWFRILDKANVTATPSTKHFELTFDLNGNAAKYLLSTTEPVNPFIPQIISNFRCQDQLD